MKALVLGASSEAIHAIQVARQRGYHVVALDGNPEAPGLASADESAVIDISDSDAVASYVGADIPACILPVPIGRALVATGELNDRWGLVGISRATAELCTDKYSFSQVLRPLGLRSATCYLAEEVLASPNLLEEMDLPLVVKPRFGSGSRGVSLVSSHEEAFSLLKEGDILEEALPGTEYGFDGLVHEGRLTPLLLRKKVNTPPPVCQCVGYQALSRDDPAFFAVVSLIDRIVFAIGLNEGLLHADVMFDGKCASVIELSGRPSGHCIHSHLVPLATGFDPIELFLSCCVEGEELPIPGKVRPMYMGFFDLGEGVVRKMPSQDQLMRRFGEFEYQVSFNVGDRLGKTLDGGVTKRGHFIIPGSGESALRNAKDLLNMFEIGPS